MVALRKAFLPPSTTTLEMRVKEESGWFCQGCGEQVVCGEMRCTDDGEQLCEVCYEEWRVASEWLKTHRTSAETPADK